jgi:hypothetical protein
MTQTRHFCTYFDAAYLTRGLALYDSLVAHCRPFHLWVLCMDSGSSQALRVLDLPHLSIIPLPVLEAADSELRSTAGTRSRIEYYFTCTPAFPLFVFAAHSDVDTITYIDADLYFFSDPSSAFVELNDYSVGITAHRFPPALSEREVYGQYNVGYLMFRSDETGLACLRSWRRECIAWCFDRLEHDRFADQKYLDAWPNRWPGIRVIEHPGVNLAPWNIESHILSEKDGALLVDNAPLVCFHFHGVRSVNDYVYDPGLESYSATLSPIILKSVYAPYLASLAHAESVSSSLVATDGRERPPASGAVLRLEHHSTARRGGAPTSIARLVKAVLRRRYIVRVGGYFMSGGQVLRSNPPSHGSLRIYRDRAND